MAQLFANNAKARLQSSITNVATSITLQTGQGALFPSPTGGDYFLATMYQYGTDGEINHEIVKCTARSGDILTVVRAQEGTSARAFDATNPLELRVTRDTIGDLNNTSVTTATLTATAGTVGGVDITTASNAQNLTNKSLVDSTTYLIDEADNTKKAQFQLSGIATTTTRTITLPNSNTTIPIMSQVLTFSGPTAARTYTLPDANHTLAALGVAQTFTLAQTVDVASAATNTVTNVLTVTSQSSGTPAAGIGVGVAMRAETAAGNVETGVVLEAVTTDVTAASEDFDFVVKTMAAGATASESFRVKNTGGVTIPTGATYQVNGTQISAGNLSNGTTGSGNVVLATSPSLTTPTLGVASATSINKVALTAPATGSTLTIADGKTLTASNTLTLAGTDSTTMTFPSTSQTIAGLGVAQTFTAKQTVDVTDATTNAVTQVARVSHQTSGTPATGIGVGLEFAAETSASNVEVGATIEAVTVDVTAASEDFDLVFKTMAAGAAASEGFRVKNTGGVTIPTGASYMINSVSVLGTTTSVSTTGTIELGHATDTTLSRGAAGILSVEGKYAVTSPGAYAVTLAGPSVARTYTLPDSDSTLAALGTAQVWSAQQTFSETKDTVYALSGTAIDPINGSIQVKTLTVNTTFTEALEEGQAVLLGIDDGTNYTVTWPTMTWVRVGGSASAPTLATAGYTWVMLWKVGTTLYGTEVGKP